MVLCLSEQYLIRAEGRAELGKITGSGSAAEDLNAINAYPLMSDIRGLPVNILHAV